MDKLKRTPTAIETYRSAYKDSEAILTEFSKNCGLSDGEYWIMLAVREGLQTQRDICERYFISKQTVNSACLALRKKKMLTTEAVAGDLRAKRLVLTSCGERFATQYIDVIFAAEEEIWKFFDETERQALIGLTRKYNALMRQELRLPREKYETKNQLIR